MSIHDQGHIGTLYSGSQYKECFTDRMVRGDYLFLEYPRESSNSLLSRCGLVVGAVIDGIPVVKTSFGPKNIPDFWSLDSPEVMEWDNSPNVRSGADEEIVLKYTAYDPLDRSGKQLAIEVTQRVLNWRYDYTEDFCLLVYRIKNVGTETLSHLYAGVVLQHSALYFAQNDVTRAQFIERGHLSDLTLRGGCDRFDSVTMAWWSNPDGITLNGQFITEPTRDGTALIRSNRSAMGLAFMDYPSVSAYKYSYNNWVSGVPHPQLLRSLSPDLSSYAPHHLSESDLYHLLSNGEVDFDSPYISRFLDHSTEWYLSEIDSASQFSSAFSYATLSRGPFFLLPGTDITIVFALVGGENFHVDPSNGANLPDNPDAWYDGVDFSDLHRNASMAQWVYDNPGIDTDGDGYAGEYAICTIDSQFVDGAWVATQLDTVWYRGDGVPDYVAARPPQPPTVWAEPIPGGIKVRFNGAASENTKDIFLRTKDFEGYKVYMGLDTRRESMSLLGTYDIENYDKYVFLPDRGVNDSWQIRDRPFTLDELRCLYADSCSDSTWHPLYFDQLHAYTHPEYPDSLFYFSRHGYNRSELGVSTPIVKSYPGARDPRTGPASQLTDDDYTDDGYLKYFEYEMEITNLLSTIPYYVGVTAYDFGHPDEALPTLESNLDSTLVELLPHSRSVGSEGDKVYVYPNPYRGDQRYHLHGYEGRNDDRFHERTRRIYFRNLPPQCVIRIHSLDGDLIDEIVHDRTPSDPNADNDYWDVITRSELRPVSGLYYWSVESPDGEVQIGKLMLIF